MPTETQRTQSRKQVLDGVWIPVIDKISFIDTVNRGQETQYSYDNTFNNVSRAVHTRSLSSADGSGTLSVERIDKVKVLDKVDRGQEANFVLSNNDPAPANKNNIGGSGNHWKTQYVRYCQNNNPSSPVWVDVEQIIELHVLDGVNRGQESRYKLSGWPPANDPIGGNDPFKPTFAACDMTLPVSNNSDAFPEKPARLDPWQNIVNFGENINLILGWTYHINASTVDLPGSWGQPCEPITLAALWSQPSSFSGTSPIILVESNEPGGNLDPAFLDSVSGPPSVTSGTVSQDAGEIKVLWGPPVSSPGPVQTYMTYATAVTGVLCLRNPGDPTNPVGETFPNNGPVYVVNQPSLIMSAAGQFIIYNGLRYNAAEIISSLVFEGGTLSPEAPYVLSIAVTFR